MESAVGQPRRRIGDLVSGLRFGIILFPLHPVGQSPTVALEKDLELLEWMDRWNFDEAWVGEHHSAGYEIIASPEVFIGIAAERTKHIKLGTGVSSLPYHHPLLLADRMVMLDHLTRGRTMLGCGPGQLTSDAHMLGIPADQQRPRMEERSTRSWRCCAVRPSLEDRWFTLDEARIHLAPYCEPRLEMAVAASVSPAGPRAAGRHGLACSRSRPGTRTASGSCVITGRSWRRRPPRTAARWTARTGG